MLTEGKHLLLNYIMRTGFGSWDCWDIHHPKCCKGLCSFMLDCGLFSGVCKSSMTNFKINLPGFHQTSVFTTHKYTMSIQSTYRRTINISWYALVGSDCCVVKILDTYLSKLPSMSPHIYTRPLDSIPDGLVPWYTRC